MILERTIDAAGATLLDRWDKAHPVQVQAPPVDGLAYRNSLRWTLDGYAARTELIQAAAPPAGLITGLGALIGVYYLVRPRTKARRAE